MKELRNSSLELRLAPESRTVEGYALVFNKESKDLGGFVEKIDPAALDGVLEKSDTFASSTTTRTRGCLHGAGTARAACPSPSTPRG